MPDQKGSLLDRIKAFFIRRKKNKLKKKEQQRKELEQILKNISEKVVSDDSIVVKTGVAVEKLNLNKVVLSTPEKTIQINTKKAISHIPEKTVVISEEKVAIDIPKTNDKIPTKQEQIEETINIMDSDDLHRLRQSILSKKDNNPNKTILVGIENQKQKAIDIKEQINNDNRQIDSSKDNPKVENIEGIQNTNNKAKDNIVIQGKTIDIEPIISDNKKQPVKTNNIKLEVSNEAESIKDNSIKPEVQNEKHTIKPTMSKKEIVVKKSVANKIKFIKNTKIKTKTIKMFNLKSKVAKKQEIKSKEEEVTEILLRMIDRNLEELSYFKEELEFLTDQNKNAKTKEDIEEIEQRFLILKERLEKVYNDFLLYRDANLLENIGELNYNEELVDLITKYKLDIKDNENIEQILKNIESDFKENLNVIESIVCLEQSKEVLSEEIYETKEDIRIRDEEIEATDEIVDKITYMKKQLDQNIDSNKEIISSVIDKINSIHPEERVRYQFNIANNLINSALNFTFAMAMLNPSNGRLANTVGAVSMVNSIRSFGRIFTPEREVYYVSSNDFESEILEHLNDFTYINRNLDMGIEEIEQLKEVFDDKYLEFIDDVPEIKETYNNINELEEQLKDIKIEMKYQEMRLEQTRVINNQIVKSIER